MTRYAASYARRYTLPEIHIPTLLLIICIATGGFMMLYSAAGGNLDPWAKAQLIRFVPATLLMLGMCFIPTRILLHYSYLIYAACIALLVAVDIAGHMGMGAQRWFAIGSVNIQPSELTKLAVILALARYFHYNSPEKKRSVLYLIPPLLLMALPAFFILRQPNLGTTTILVCTGIMIWFIAGLAWRYVIIAIGAVLTAAPLAWELLLHDYQKQRVLTFLNPEEDPLGTGYNILQSIIAIGSGGLSGTGYLKGSQGQLDFLPEKQTDFIFTMLGEEFGFIGSTTVIMLYSALILSIFSIGLRSKHRFGTYVCAGLSSMIFLHLFINVGMSMGLLPVVGVPLPLFSYGGTMLITILIGFGLAFNIWAHRNTPLPDKNRLF
jgi:rod shape determining protein RodA